jgi:uncharacterized protein involved in outer membrane biogenesis
MSKPLKLTLLAIAALLAVLVLGAAIMLLSWRGHAKSEVQAGASDALGMDVKIGGRLTMRYFPSVAMTLEDVHIGSHGTDIASAGEASLGIQLISLLRRQVRIASIELKHVTLTVERGRDGKFSFGAASSGSAAIPDIESTDVTLTDLTFVYANRQEGTGVRAAACNVEASDLRVAAGTLADLMKNLSMSAKVTCGQLTTRDLPMTDVEFAAESSKGVLETKNVTLRAFGGRGSATVRADFSGSVPAYRVHGVLSKFRLAEFRKNFSQKKIGDGPLDFATDLTMTGSDADAMTRSSSGTASLHGTGLTLDVGDLDDELAHYKATQRFSLMDLGAVLLAGPIGLAVTKGLDYAKVMHDTAGTSQIQTFISEWQVERGVAQARDVALSTKANRIALKGNLDFVNHSFEDVTLAVLNKEGCATLVQKVHGSFSQPEVDKPNVVIAIAGPAMHLINKAKHLVGAGQHCEVFYAGSLPPPQAASPAAAQ